MKKTKDLNIGVKSIIDAVQNDAKLTHDEKLEFLSLANIYSAQFNDNLSKSSVELSEESGLDLDTWKRFLSHPPVKRILESYINERIKKKADAALLDGSGTRDAINVRKAMLEAETHEDNTKFVILRLPERVQNLDE